MKEVFLLPTTCETLFQPLSKQVEKRSFPLEDGMSFRDYLEQAKSASDKPYTKRVEGQPSQVQERDPEPTPISEESKPDIDVEKRSDAPEAVSETQVTDAPAVTLGTEPAVIVSCDLALTLNQNEGNSVQLQEKQPSGSLERMAELNFSPSNDLLLMHSLSSQAKATEANQNLPNEKAFIQLLQTQDQTTSSAQEMDGNDQTPLQPKASIRLEPQSSNETDGDKFRNPAGEQKEIGKVTTEQMPETASEKSPNRLSAITQEKTSGKSFVTESSRLGESVAQPSSVKEGLKPEAVQASGPPLNLVTAKPIEPARLAEAHRPEIVQQVARELEIFGKSGQTSLRIQLYPEQLGRIDVRLISRTDGVQIVIHADNASTASMLERDLNFLRESLVQAGVNLSSLTVGNGQAQTRSNLAQSEFQSPNQSDSKFANDQRQKEGSPGLSERGWRDSSSTFDYRI